MAPPRDLKYKITSRDAVTCRTIEIIRNCYKFNLFMLHNGTIYDIEILFLPFQVLRVFEIFNTFQLSGV